MNDQIPPPTGPEGFTKNYVGCLQKMTLTRMTPMTVALELADKGIRVNGIAPGAIATDMNKEMLEDKEQKKKKEDKIPMHRIGKPEEIAKAALFLASNDASYITGLRMLYNL